MALGFICEVLNDKVNILYRIIKVTLFLLGSDGKESACNAGDSGSIFGSGRSLGEGNGYPFQFSCLENSMYRGPRQATVNGVAKNQKQLIK